MKSYFSLLGILFVHLFLLTSLQFTAWPEMFSYPYLHNNHYLLYVDMIHPYPPLLTLALGIIYKVFGYNLISLEIATWSLFLCNTILIFLISFNISQKRLPSLLTAFIYALFQPILEGNMMWFDIAIVTPILLSTLFFLKWIGKRSSLINLILSGLFLSIAFFIKQTVGLYFLASIFILWRNKADLKQLALFFLPVIFMGLVLLIRLIQEDSLSGFLNWTLLYPFLYWSHFPGYVQMKITFKDLALILFFILPAIFVLINNKITKNVQIQLLLLFLLCGFISVYPRFSFFHFQSALAFLVLISVYLLMRKLKWITFGAALILGGVVYHSKLPQNLNKQARFYSIEDKNMASYISNVTSKQDRIFLLGLPSQLYVLSDRLPPKIWADNFGWYLEIPEEQKKVLASWDNNPPKFIFRQTPEKGNWFDLGTYEPQEIVQYMKSNYNFKGEVRPGVELWQRKENI